MAQQQSVDAAGGAGGLWRRRRAVVSWCLFDWANSAYPTLIVTFVFAAYFTRAVAASPEEGTAAWGTAISLSALFVAVLSPVFGAVADQGGRRKPWLLVTSVVCIASSALLWYVTPHMAFLWIPLVLVAIGNASFEAGQVFYNAMLPEIAPRSHLGRLSGWAWGMGYAGGLACLTLALLLFVQPQHPLFGLDKATAEDVRITGPLVALWFALFAVPLFLWTPDKPSSGLSHREAVTRGLATLADTLRNLRRHRNAAHFLIARMIYTDGLNTLFAFGGIYADGTFGMTFDEILVFGIILNVAAGLGAAAFAWIDDWIGPKRTVIIALLGDPADRGQADVLRARLRDRQPDRTGPSRQPLVHGAPGAGRDPHRDVRALRALGQGDRLRRPGPGRLGHLVGRQPARRHGDDRGVLRGRPLAAAAGALAAGRRRG
jgi:UMF1 family MFS transporter